LVILANTVKEDLVHDTRSQSARRSRPEDISCISRTACILFRRSSCSLVRRSKAIAFACFNKNMHCLQISFSLCNRCCKMRDNSETINCGLLSINAPIEATLRRLPQESSLLQRKLHSTMPKRCLYFPCRGTEILDWVAPSCHSRNRWSVQQGGQSSTDVPRNKRQHPGQPVPPLSGLNLLQFGALIKLGPPIGAPRRPTGALFSCPKHSASLGTLTSIFPEGLKCFSHDQIPLHPLLQTCLRCRCAGCSAFAHNPSHTACLPLI
jgi:hypothetical protein